MKKLAAITVASILAASISLPAAMAATQSAEVKSSVSFRESPSTSSNVMRYLSKGEGVTVLNEVNAYWYQVKDQQGTVGYVSSNDKYINVTQSNSGEAAKSGSGNAVIQSSVSLRKSASTTGERIRYLSKGESVSIISQPNSYWYEVKDASGNRGFISTSPQFVKVNAGQSVPGGNNSNTGGSVSKPPVGQASKVEAIIAAGNRYLGTPYEFGSDRNSTRTFDCSAFIRAAFRDGANITLPSDSRQQGDYVKAKGKTSTNWKQLKRGDLMFFMSYKGTKESAYSGINKAKATITHAGIYLGNGQILHTYSKESGGVRVDSIAGKHWEYRFLFGGSAL